MKRFHVHVAVSDLEASVKFYSAMFATVPRLHKPDYAKWMLDDPRINFAIFQRGLVPGVDHLGIQVDSEDALMSCVNKSPARKLKRRRKTRRLVATRNRTNTGLLIRKALPGKPFIPSVIFRPSAKIRKSLPVSRPMLVACRSRNVKQ